MKSREGNEIPPVYDDIRDTISIKTGDICAECKHVLDECRYMTRELCWCGTHMQIVKCDGFEEVTG